MILDLRAAQAMPIGAIFLIGRQLYELIDAEPYQRADAKWSAVLVWRTQCPTCGDYFTVRTGRAIAITLTRRCERHRKPAPRRPLAPMDQCLADAVAQAE